MVASIITAALALPQAQSSLTRQLSRQPLLPTISQGILVRHESPLNNALRRQCKQVMALTQATSPYSPLALAGLMTTCHPQMSCSAPQEMTTSMFLSASSQSQTYTTRTMEKEKPRVLVFSGTQLSWREPRVCITDKEVT